MYRQGFVCVYSHLTKLFLGFAECEVILVRQYRLFYRALLQKRPVTCEKDDTHEYVVAPVSSMHKIIGLICRISSFL